MEMIELNGKINSILNNSAEEYAQRIKEDYLTSQCIYSGGKKYFVDYNDYLSKTTDLVYIIGKSHVVGLMNGIEDDFMLKLPESKYLIDNGFMTKEGLEIDEETGYKVDALTGKFVDDNNDFIDKDGKKIDEFGNLLEPKKRGRKKKE
jgi:hypothetical protein